jgi:hypothetical protein
MSEKRKEDYRTNRADYVIAAQRSRAIAKNGDREELLAELLRDRRSSKLAANPSESSREPKARRR